MGADKNSSRWRWRLQQDEHSFQHTSPTQYPSWPSPRSHWSATGPRNQQTTFRSETRNTHSGNLHSLLPVLHMSDLWPVPVRPVTSVRPVDRARQAGGYNSSTTSVLESLNDFSRPWNKNNPKTQLARKEKPYTKPSKTTPNRPRTDQQHQDQRHTSQAVHPWQIPQVTCTDLTGQEHGSDRCNLGSLG
jgi:hypothetical protein